MQLISSSYNIIKPIYMHPLTVRELHKHKIQKNKKKLIYFAELQMSTVLVQRPRYRYIYLFLVMYGPGATITKQEH